MESLLSLSFDNISSRDTARISRGLRQIEGLLAQVCLTSPKQSPHKRKNSAIQNESPKKQKCDTKSLDNLRDDAAFREFFRLQDGFQWNGEIQRPQQNGCHVLTSPVAIRLIETLERLLGMGNASDTDLVILAALDLLQGILLLHPPSRSLFSREDYMNLILDLLDPCSNPPKIQSQALLVLVTSLLDCPKNTRVFENIDGLLTVTSLFKSRSTTKDVKMVTLEFLYFYLMAEKSPLASASAPNTAFAPRTPVNLHARTHSGDGGLPMDLDEDAPTTKTTSEKQRLLERYLSKVHVEELVADINENAVFGKSTV